MKKTKREIEETLRNKLSKKYNVDLEYYKDLYNTMRKSYYNEVSLRQKLLEENQELKEKLEQYEDWVNRLQEFMDMPENIRKAKFEEEIKKKQFKTYVEGSGFWEAYKTFLGF